jgi:Ca2+-binding RTX toxin-like protein
MKGRSISMRLRALLILATRLLGVMALSGAALAATKTCSANPCEGTDGPDRLKGNDAKNEIRGLRGPDYIAGKQRADELYGGGGNDTTNAQDSYEDGVNCGLGTDTAYVDRLERVNEDCENVFVAGGGPEPTPVVDMVSGKGELGARTTIRGCA